MAAAPTSAAAGTSRGGGGGGNNVLSDKVNRALHVRTDTPAMRAALDALANLPTDDDAALSIAGKHRGVPQSSGTGRGGGVIDARSVRAAIEQDALRRALEFQKELQKLARDASTLRERVDNVAKVASLVGRRVESQIVDVSEPAATNEGGPGRDGDPFGAPAVAPPLAVDAWEEERNLAARLAHAQKSYVEAARRQVAVDAFLDKFDLGDDEARLLDRYNFEGFAASDYVSGEDEGGNAWGRPGAALSVVPNPSQGAMDEAMAFLDALERLTVIRRELTKTFGSGAAEPSDVPFDGLAADCEAGGGRLGAHSALRMMEGLALRQERAHERLYQFLQFFLGIGVAQPSSGNMSVPTSSTDTGRSLSASDVAQSHGALGRFHDGDEMDEAFNHPVVRRCLHVLRHSRPHRLHALELIAAGRRTEVTRRFLLALTSGYGGMAPLEMKAHDPVGYVGDMLAFAFRAFRVEGELVKSLFSWRDGEGEDEEQEEEGDRGNDDGSFKKVTSEEEKLDIDDDAYKYGDEQGENKPINVTEMLAQSMGGLARPLRTRISQVVSSLASQGGDGLGGGDGHRGDLAMGSNDQDEDETSSSSLNRLVAVFSVCGLLRFYGSAVQKALVKLEEQTSTENVSAAAGDRRAENPFLATCDECLAEAADSYVASLRAFGAMLQTHALGSPESEAQLASLLIARISEERSASPGFAEDFVRGEEEGDAVSRRLSLSFLVGTMVDAAMPHVRTLDDGAALRSALNVASKCGLGASDSGKWSELILATEGQLVEAFVDAETDEVLQVCGLESLRSAFRHMDSVFVEGITIMSSHPGMSQRDVETAMGKFYSSLFSPPIPTFEDTIKDPELRKVARSKTAARVADVYRELYEAITSEKGGYADLAFLGHNPDQVKTLLSL
eukprot:CAMPEP_0172527940 /NCGR_PEP_ID=MMETSP1067-20121228/2473_1 /TAXON_ID=265564 ORGANISM="Thalassiosira punctigera, Strain Tpunct2005C2" /NCGR_SAMPLE_ID=MMETSP1067 /ASSEMBLY_ACC=CAM_ASM_000444 /LENGTH=900 /DNA_ID=CAMNT_0013311771 /DNA_START=50 /DNA_END=2752 /DNA_ORIENTATION=+